MKVLETARAGVVLSFLAGLLAGCGGGYGGGGGGMGPPASLNISVAPSSITLGQSATITWNTNGNTCTASGDWTGNKSASGSETVTPATAGTFTYSLRCRGGGYGESNTGSATLTVNAAQMTGMSVGPIASFGSVVVNGVHFDTTGATISVNGQPATQDDLRVGQVVRIEAEMEHGATVGTATSVTFDANVEGPIASLDAAAGVLVVLGQTVHVGADTSFDDSIQPRSIAGLAVGDFIEVSGLVMADGSIAATRIEKRAAAGDLEVSGVVSNLDAANHRFTLAALVVDYSAATLDDFPAGQIENGQAVEANGAALNGGGELVASRVEFKGETIEGEAGDFTEVEGFVTRFASAQDFDVAGACVTTGAATVFEGGTAADLALDVKVEVEGQLDGNGCIAAAKVDIRLGTDVRVTAFVDSVDTAASSLVLLGIGVDVDALTRLEDHSDARVEPLAIDDLAAGDCVAIRGAERPAASGRVRASILERENADACTEIRGFVTAAASPTFTILGLVIETDGATEFQDANGVPLSQAEFFGTLAAGALVKARGTEIADTTILAGEVELEQE